MSRTGLPASNLRGNAFVARVLLTLIFACLYQAVSNNARAAIHCAEDGTGLRDALVVAGSNGESDNIRIRTGSHTTSNLLYYGSEPFDLTISGGWSPGCFFLETRNPLDTWLHGGSDGHVLKLTLFAGDDIHIENLSFRTTNITNDRSALYIDGSFITGFEEISIERVAFIDNIAVALQVVGAVDDLRIKSSLFYQNSSRPGSSYPTIIIRTEGNVYFTNNTVVSNTPEGPIGGVSLVDAFGTQAYFANNILWGNDGADLGIEANSTVILENNNIEDLGGTPDENSNNLSVDPMFEADLYTPRYNSPMVDAGTPPPIFVRVPTPFEDLWSLGNRDFSGDDREQGGKVDIGAIEAFPEVSFANGYE